MVRKLPKLALWPKRLTQGWSEIVIMKYKQALFAFYFLVIMFICFWFDQEAGITFTGYFIFK